jgi:hypothetical protein
MDYAGTRILQTTGDGKTSFEGMKPRCMMATNILLEYHESFEGSSESQGALAHGPPAETRLILAIW